ncbi:hypothetical protein Tco_0889957 [Tanacetum coccineum]
MVMVGIRISNMHRNRKLVKLVECSVSMNNMSPNPKSNVSKSCICENSGINKIDTQIGKIMVNADNSRITVNTKTFFYANDVTNNDMELDKILFFVPTGRAGYAKVLVEIDANKEMQDQIKVVYKDAIKNTKRTKFMKAECVWRRVMCSTCKVFGHSEKGCFVEFRGRRGTYRRKEGFHKLNVNDKPNGSKEQDTQVEDDVNSKNDTSPSLKKIWKRWQQVNLEKDRSDDEDDIIEENDATNMNVIADEIIGRDTQIVN